MKACTEAVVLYVDFSRLPKQVQAQMSWSPRRALSQDLMFFESKALDIANNVELFWGAAYPLPSYNHSVIRGFIFRANHFTVTFGSICHVKSEFSNGGKNEI